MQVPPNITNFPAAFRLLAERVNFLLKFARIVANAQGKNGIRIVVTDNNMVIENNPDGGDADGSGGTPGGLPPGFRVLTVRACVNGEEQDIQILAKI